MMDQDGDPRNYDPNDEPVDYGQYVDPPPAAPPPTNYQQTPDGVPGNQWGLGPTGQEPNDLFYWLNNGVTPQGNDQSIFDSNGQLRPGWARTANGYERVAAPDPYAGSKIPTSYGGGINYAQYGSGAPVSHFENYESAGPFAPRNPTFSYTPFTETSYDDLEKQPGFLDGQKRLQKQIEAGAAYRGVVRSGMALGDIWNGLDNNKEQRFSEYDSRRYRNWDGNLSASRNKFLDEYGIDRDEFDRHASDVDRGNNYRFNASKADMDDATQRWLAQVSSLTSLSKPS